jgi:dipeptidyl-peptidase-4
MKRANILLGSIWAAILVLASLTGGSATTASAQESAPIRKVEKPALTLEAIAPKQGLQRSTPFRTAFSHDGKWVAYHLGNELEVLDLQNRRLVPVMNARVFTDVQTADKGKASKFVGVREFTWSPTAAELLLVSDDFIFRWKVGDSKPTRLTDRADREVSPRYLPDGSGFTYIQNKTASSVLMRRDFAGATKTIVEVPTLQGGLWVHKASPDGKRMYYTATQWTSATAERLVSVPNFRNRFMTVQARVRPLVEDGLRSFDVKLYMVDLQAEGESKPVLLHTHSYANFGDLMFEPDWSLDSSKLVFSRFQAAKSEVALMTIAVAAETPQAEEAFRFTHKGGPDTPSMMQAYFTADEKIILLAETTGFRHPHIFDPKTGDFAPLTRGDHEVLPVQWAKDRTKLFAVSAKQGPACQDVYEVNVAGGKMRRLTGQPGVYDEVAVSPDNTTVVANFVRFGAAKTTVKINARTREQSIVLDDQSAEMKRLVTVRPDFFTYKNRHGDELHGFMFHPANGAADAKRPLLIYVYGGPLGRDKDVKEGNYREETYFFPRYMAEKHGYVTCVIDTRGMSGYGAKFEKANFEQPGRPQVEDLEDAVKFFVSEHNVDVRRVGLMGWSFGGFQTQLAMYTKPKLFAAGISVAGPTEWENYYGGYNAKVIGSRDLQRFSLLPLAKNLEGRLMLLHGAEDDVVLFQDTVQVHRELQKNGKGRQVDLHVDWTGNHYLNNGDLTTLERLKLYEDFLVRSLGHGNAINGIAQAK